MLYNVLKASHAFIHFEINMSTTLNSIQGVIESCTDILTTSYWLHVELGKNI
jgi:predicted phosphoadenosine phosphosulfate sulfurtransferase